MNCSSGPWRDQSFCLHPPRMDSGAALSFPAEQRGCRELTCLLSPPPQARAGEWIGGSRGLRGCRCARCRVPSCPSAPWRTRRALLPHPLANTGGLCCVTPVTSVGTSLEGIGVQETLGWCSSGCRDQQDALGLDPAGPAGGPGLLQYWGTEGSWHLLPGLGSASGCSEPPLSF